MTRNLPKLFLDLIIFWYSNLRCRVRWDEQLSDWFGISAGVRQGGILSPDFYCLYVDDLILLLKSKNVGCYILGIFLAALIYADDVALISPSIRGLCNLLEVCENYCTEWDICLNARKSKLLYFGKRCDNIYSPSINGTKIDWVDSCNYLGVTLVSGLRFRCSVTDRIHKFYKSANAIFRIEGRSDDLTMLRLVESYCVPILTYGIEVIEICDQSQRSKIRAAYNSLFRKILGYRSYESVSDLQISLARPTWEMLCNERKTAFYRRLSLCPADSPIHLFTVL